MGEMTVTPSMLDARDEQVNLALIVGPIGELISDEIDREAVLFADWFYEETGMDADEYCREHGLEFWDEISYDYRAMFDKVWPIVADMLEVELPEVFNPRGPVAVTDYSEQKSRPSTGLWGQEHEVAMFTWSIDGEKLWAIAREELGNTKVWDGHGASGFYRTCEDSYWAQCEVLKDLVPDGFWYRVMEELAQTSIIEDMISFGKLEEAMHN